jgi:hypothetical protein
MGGIIMKKLIPFLNVYPTGFGGYANGYVAIPKGHPFYKKDYFYINKFVDVHWGLTFAEMSDDLIGNMECEFLNGDKELPKGMWVLGFDTKHLDDNPYNCNRDFCVTETMNLMEQLENVMTNDENN